MKILFWTIALASLFLMFSVFQLDNNSYQRTADHIKDVVDSSAEGAVSYFDETAYAEGYIKIKDGDALQHIDAVLCQSFFIGAEASKLDQLSLEILIFDDSNTIRKYKKDGRAETGQLLLSLTSTDEFVANYPYIYTDGINNKTVAINEPGIIVSAKATGERYKLKFLPEPAIYGFSHYEMKGWE